MRRTWLIAGVLNGVLGSPIPDEAGQKPPSGVGTGVTIAIAPPGGSPPGCVSNWNGDFGIAAINISTFNQFFDNDLQVPANPGKMGSAGNLNLGSFWEAPSPDQALVAPTAQITNMAKFINAKAPADLDSTITVKSTRTHTRTVTVQSNIRPKAASVAPTPQPTRDSSADYKAGGKVKAAVLYQIGDGQVQAPIKPAPIPLAPKKTPDAFAPLPTGAPRVSQIGDGQIQAPTGKPARLPAPSGPAPKGPAPKGPAAGPPSMNGMASMPGMMKRAANYCTGGSKPVRMKLSNGILKDQNGRTGYIADNRQFQFDAPPQAGAQLTAGYSLCKIGDASFLALGQSTTWWQCLSGEFFNLYDKNVAPQCNAVRFIILNADDCTAL